MDTTIGGVPGGIKAGIWTVTLGIFSDYLEKCNEESMVIELNITDKDGVITEIIGEELWVDNGLAISNYDYNKVYNEEHKWYKGDFHTHTTLSDGKESVRSAMVKAKKMAMDFYVPTEHNLMHTGWCSTDVMILPGIEITTERGHCNLFDVKEIPEIIFNMIDGSKVLDMDEEMESAIEKANKSNSIVSINHPFLTVWKWKYHKTLLDNVHCIEIVNDPTYTYAKESNEKAIKFIDLLWEDGHRIWGIGGSDSHNLIDELYEGATEPSVAGDPATFVFCKGLTANNLINSVKNGHISVSRNCNITPLFTQGEDNFLPGEKINTNEPINCQVKVSNINEIPVIYAVINNEKIKLPVIKEEDYYSAEISITFNSSEYKWMRFDIRRNNGEFMAYTNPIYSGEKTSKYKTFGEIMSIMEDNIED